LPEIFRSALVGYSAEQMFDLVSDVLSYPEFLPWCSRTWVLETKGKNVVARIEVSKGAVTQSFTTRNHNIRPEEIHLFLVEGPFSELCGVWRFKSLDESACKVSLELKFEMSQFLTAVSLAPLFSQAASTMVDAFCQRAKNIFV
jgi:ribosome-associated toxin RatA of RatAB toxin-antitoxin module